MRAAAIASAPGRCFRLDGRLLGEVRHLGAGGPRPPAALRSSAAGLWGRLLRGIHLLPPTRTPVAEARCVGATCAGLPLVCGWCGCLRHEHDAGAKRRTGEHGNQGELASTRSGDCHKEQDPAAGRCEREPTADCNVRRKGPGSMAGMVTPQRIRWSRTAVAVAVTGLALSSASGWTGTHVIAAQNELHPTAGRLPGPSISTRWDWGPSRARFHRRIPTRRPFSTRAFSSRMRSPNPRPFDRFVRRKPAIRGARSAIGVRLGHGDRI